MKQVIFLHGVGGTGAGMTALAAELPLGVTAHFPDGLAPFDAGPGRQWFSVSGVTEANRPDRVAAALPSVRRMVEEIGDPRETVLIGFSQGAIMALHAAAAGMPLAGVIALSGRLAGPVAPRMDWPPISLLHGTNDPVMRPDIAQATEGWLRDAGADPVLKMFNGLAHGIDQRSLAEVKAFLAARSA